MAGLVRRAGLVLLSAWALVLLVLAAVVLGSLIVSEATVQTFLADPASEDVYYRGYASTLGVLGWWTGAVVCLGTAAVLWHRAAYESARRFAVAGGVTAYLAIDDALLIHEAFLVTLGVPEKVTVGVYVVAVAVLIALGLGFLRQTPWPILVLAGAFFAVSIAIDVITADEILLLEDGAKFFGIATLGAYFVVTATEELDRVLGARMESGV
jgi:hypothetical protein